MPEVIAAHLNGRDFQQLRQIQQAVLDAYALDFSKHAPPVQVMKIMNVWQSIPSQLAKENKKFIFSALHKSARAREYETAIQWLSDAGLIYKSHVISAPRLPLEGYADKNAFKVFLLDVGLLGAMSRLPPNLIVAGHQLFTEFKGALTENFVAQSLIPKHGKALYYWVSGGTAEIDFIVADQLSIYPLEVKSGVSVRSKSLQVYQERYHPHRLSRASLLNFTLDGNLLNYPLYLAYRFPISGRILTR